MNKNIFKFIFVSLIFSLAIFAPNSVLAATAYLNSESETINIGDTAMVSLFLDTQNQPINVVEGVLAINSGAENIEVRDISVAGASLDFWMTKPSWDKDKATFNFAGGVPNGFNKADGLLFKFFVVAKKAGQVIFNPAEIIAYANDGKGTAFPAVGKALTLNVVNAPDGTAVVDELKKTVSSDNLPPESLTATVGQDASLYDGKLFLYISAIDNQSGMDFIELKEGDLPTVRTGNNYVLQDQTQGSVITITAHDKAGNVKTLVINPTQSPTFKSKNFLPLAIIVLVLWALVFIIKRNRRKK